MRLDFDWDPAKAASNLVKHGISFPDAATLFDDPLAFTYGDPEHSLDEVRFLTFGHTKSGMLLAVVHAERFDKIRLISARPATSSEGRQYAKRFDK